MEHDVPREETIERLLGTLRALPGVRADLAATDTWAASSNPRAKPDATINLEIGGESTKLIVETKKEVYPRDVHGLVHRLKTVRDRLAHDFYVDESHLLSIVAADAISPGAKEELKKSGIGYFDSGGSLYIPARNALVLIDKPPPKTLRKAIQSIFSGRRSRIAHALLMSMPRDTWHNVKSMARDARVSMATSSQVLTEMERQGWMRSNGAGPSKKRQLVEPGALLDAWSERMAQQPAPRLQRYYVPRSTHQELDERIGQAFDRHQVQYALTHEAAAQLYSPFLTTVSQIRCRVVAGQSVIKALRSLDAAPVNEGANLAVIDVKSTDDLLYRRRVDGKWLASPTQVYLDLARSEGRAKEMAAHLRSHLLSL